MRHKRAKDVMSTDVLVVEDTMPASDLAAFFGENEISGAPVVDEDYRLVGVISLADLARAAAEEGNAAPDRGDPSYYLREWEEHYNPEEIERLRIVDTDVTVRDLMSDRILAVGPDTPVAECARQMLEQHRHRLLVTDGDTLYGIVTSFDLLGLVAEVG